MSDVLDRPVEFFFLPTRVGVRLRRHGIKTLGDLVTCKPCELLDIRQFGVESLRATEQYLEEFELTLEKDDCHEHRAPYAR